MKRQGPPKDRFTIAEFTNPRTGTTSWRVAGTKRDGSRVRDNFSDPEEARNRQNALESEFLARKTDTAIRSTRLTETQVAIAEAAFRLVEEDDDLLIAVRHWLTQGKPNSHAESPRLDDAFEQFRSALEADASLRPLSRTATRLRVSGFVNATQNVHVSEVTPELVEKFLDRIGKPRARVNYKHGISKFMSWCLDRPRRWIAVNPTAAIKIRMGDEAPPVIFSVEDCERIVRAAEKFKGGRLLPYLTVTMFAGVRPFEARRMKWGQINFDDGEIRIEGVQSKTGRSRTFKMDETTLSWLRSCKGREFFPDNFANDWPEMLRNAGFGSAKAGLRPWVKDVLRHTSISHFFRKSGSYGLAAERFGNSEAVIKRHYQGRVTTADTAKFYDILPEAKGTR